jgi:hypothetical protein
MLHGNTGWKNRICTFLLALLLMSSACSASVCFPYALAEETEAPPISINVSLEPEQLVSPDEVLMAFELINHSDQRLEDITITSSDGLSSESIDRVEPFATQTILLTHSVSQSELDAGTIAHVLTCETEDGRFSYHIETIIVKKTPRAE